MSAIYIEHLMNKMLVQRLPLFGCNFKYLQKMLVISIVIVMISFYIRYIIGITYTHKKNNINYTNDITYNNHFEVKLNKFMISVKSVIAETIFLIDCLFIITLRVFEYTIMTLMTILQYVVICFYRIYINYLTRIFVEPTLCHPLVVF